MATFVSFEGPDGSGKSTQVHLLGLALREAGLPVIETREPGATPLGERVRDLILDPDSPAPTPLTMALLLSAARAQLIETVIRPALARGVSVITDRFADSTLAYQGYGFGLDLDDLRTLARIACGGLLPDPVVYVDIDPERGMQRVVRRGVRNRLDNGSLEFHRRVRDGYLTLARAEPERWLVVDGDRPPDQVHAEILAALLPRLQERQPA